ncbi:MAG: tetratricopeptide repeat protein [Chloroflexi bacterium]|nr:tetratricopeptide repeat protein [Chloroflexota bacterium]
MNVILTKVRLPKPRKDILRRGRLIDALHKNLHRKLTFVSAPAGFGKTTLLVDFASDVGVKVCWYSVGVEDVDLVPFAQHLIAAFQQKVPDFGKEIAQILNAPVGHPEPRSLASEFINEVENQLDDFFILIIDDYHLVDEKPQIVDFIEALLEYLPDQIRLVIGSRSIYGIPTASLYVREDLGTLSTDDLRFRADELQTLIRTNYQLKLSDKQAADLAKRSDGWIVAILLAMRSWEHGALPKFEGATEQVYSFLAKEVVDMLPKHLKEFLVATSILNEFDEPLCNHLLEISSAGENIKEIEARNLFVTRIETAQGFSYRYHHLFADFLREEFSKSDSTMKAAFHNRAANWFENLKSWELAIHHKLAAQDRLEAARWIDLASNEMYVAGRHIILSRWYEIFNEDPNLRQHAPHFMVDRAKSLLNEGEYEKAEELLDIIEAALQEQPDEDLSANAIVTRGMLRRYQGDFNAAVELAEVAQKSITKQKKGKEKGYRWFQAERLKGISLGFLNKPDESILHLKIAVDGIRKLFKENTQQQNLAHDLVETLTDLGIVYFQNNHIYEAQSIFLEALEIRRKIKSNRGSLATARNNVAYLFYKMGRYREAWRETEQALEEAQSVQWKRIIVIILNSRGDLLCDLDEWEAAEKEFEAALKVAESIQEQVVGLDETYLGLSRIERFRGNYNEAFYWLREAAALQPEGLESPICQTEIGGIYLEMGQLDLAANAFRSALQTWENNQHPSQEQALAAFLLSRVLFEDSAKDEASTREVGEYLSLSLNLTARLGHDQFLVDAGRRAQKLLSFARKTWPNPHLDTIATRAENFQTGMMQLEVAVSVTQAPSAHLEIYAFGSGEVKRNGERIPRSEWRSTRARALFFNMVDSQRIRKEELALDFWPEFSPAKVSSNFHATLWRVRNAIGGKDLVIFEDGYYLLHPGVSIWYDVDEFDRYFREAGFETTSQSERVENWRRAIALYEGAYLKSIFMDWADRRRQELQDNYLLMMSNLADHEILSSNFNEAITLCENILSIEPYRDPVHLMLMNCLVKKGAPSAAIAHFKEYEDLLKRELKIDPTPELQAIMDGLSTED